MVNGYWCPVGYLFGWSDCIGMVITVFGSLDESNYITIRYDIKLIMRTKE